jgi:Na+-driven multidrug efflux pump
MNLVDLFIYAILFLLGKWLLSLFVKTESARGDGDRNPYSIAMRYVGFVIIFSFIGLMVAVCIVVTHIFPSLPRDLVVFGPIGLGISTGILVAYRHPNSIADSQATDAPTDGKQFDV